MTSSSKKPGEGARSSYARFIPREELTGFAAWAPGQFDPRPPVQDPTGATEPRPADAGPAAGTEAAAAPETPSPEQRIREAHDKGYQDGYRDGLAALEAARQQLAAQQQAQVSALLQGLSGAFDEVHRTLAPRVADIAVAIARQVVRQELRQHPGVVVHVAQEALDALVPGARRVVLKLHPLDAPLVRDAAADLLALREAQILTDDQLARGGCIVESDLAVVDASLPAAWQRALALIGRGEAGHPPLPIEPAPIADPLTEPAQEQRP